MCLDLQCEWQVGTGGEKYLRDAKIVWKYPVWKNKDLAKIAVDQGVVLPDAPMCAVANSQVVPMIVPGDLSFFDGMSPGMAMDQCREMTKKEALQLASGGRAQPLVNDIEMGTHTSP